MSRVTVSLGRARNSSHVQRRGSSTSPTMEKSHWSSGVCGVGPAERTGKSGVTYWPGGTRSLGTSSRRRPLKPRDMIGGISPPYRCELHPQHPVRATIGVGDADGSAGHEVTLPCPVIPVGHEKVPRSRTPPLPRSEGSYLRRAGWCTDKGGVVSAELVQDVLDLALADGLAENFEDRTNGALPLLVAEGNDAGDASHELARWKSLRPPIVFQAGPDRLWQLRGEVVGFPWVDTRA